VKEEKRRRGEEINQVRINFRIRTQFSHLEIFESN
jgi:hypothetical protein